MGRRLPKHLSPLGQRILKRMRDLQLEPLELAAAAGLSPSTLYRIMRKRGADSTDDPRLRTKRRLAHALQVPMVDLFQETQLEILDECDPPIDDDPDGLERLIRQHLRRVSTPLTRRAARAAAVALADVFLAVSVDLNAEEVRILRQAETATRFHDLLLSLFRRLPDRARREGARAAIHAMLAVERAYGISPSKGLYRSIARTHWGKARLERDRPPV